MPSSMLQLMGEDIVEALELLNVPSYLIDAAGVVRWLNPAAQALVGDVNGHQFTSVVALRPCLFPAVRFLQADDIGLGRTDHLKRLRQRLLAGVTALPQVERHHTDGFRRLDSWRARCQYATHQAQHGRDVRKTFSAPNERA